VDQVTASVSTPVDARVDAARRRDESLTTPTPVAGTPDGSALPRRPAEPVRGDIQGLRAVAVLIVLVFHFWPGLLTGGYVGVDVFFVISGFLISSHLLRSPPTTARMLGAFWARRIRRLLPAASLVLAATFVASIAWLPSTQIPGVARETIASALSVENWALARTATDYLAAESAPSPVQHYWSLSVEEQFYLFWPVLIAILWFVGRHRRPIMWCAAGLGVVTAASLTTSVLLTDSDPAAAYFVTPTRVWELGRGSLLAVAVHLGWRLHRPLLRAALGWVGIAMIAYAALRFDATTPFPGTTALVPTVGAALVIAAATDALRWSPGALLGLRPSRALGDVSYSVYLWHWPVVVIAPYALSRDLTDLEKGCAVAAVLVVAALTKRFVEDPVRRSRVLVGSLPRSFAIAAASVLLLGTAGVVVIQRSDADVAAQEAALTGKLSSSDCVGAEAMRNPGCTSIEGLELLSSPAVARADKSVLYAQGCWSNRPFTARPVCTFGNPAGSVRMALLGNSHAGHWQPALASIAADHGWRLDTYLASQCYTVDLPLELGSDRATRNCRTWNRWAVRAVTRGDYDLVVMSDRTFQQIVGVKPADKRAVAQRAYADTLRTITASGTPVLVLRDVPAARVEVPDCVAAHPGEVDACASPENRALEADPLHAAALADTSGLVGSLDLTDRFCRDGRCHVVIGGLIAYFDHGHITTTFARTLVPDIEPAVEKALASGS
jgi:peptidoglycan/LPS O-acetylase OafA/YrhL